MSGTKEQPTRAAFQILLALAEGEKHGYAIMQEIESRTGGEVRLGPGSLYRAIKEMLAAGWIEESAERPAPELDDGRRRYYRLTGLGRQVAAAETERLAALVIQARTRLRLAGRPE